MIHFVNAPTDKGVDTSNSLGGFVGSPYYLSPVDKIQDYLF